MTARRLLILGGARSGKSREAQRLAAESTQAVTMIVTAEVRDEEMAARIARHRAERPAGWSVVEAPLDIAGAIQACAPDTTIIIDCLTLWLANAMEAGHDIERETKRLLDACQSVRGPLICVSNETGLGIVPATPLGRRFRDAQGLLNQTLARECDAVVLMVSGLPIVLKPTPMALALT